ncbi:unnamed protein product [Cochlearia groenlandica]
MNWPGMTMLLSPLVEKALKVQTDQDSKGLETTNLKKLGGTLSIMPQLKEVITKALDLLEDPIWKLVKQLSEREDMEVTDLDLMNPTVTTIQARQDGSKKPSPLKWKKLLYKLEEHNYSGEDIMSPRPRLHDSPLDELPQKALEEALGDIRNVMVQYTSCADQSESAARKKRAQRAEELGQVEETTTQMVRTTLLREEHKKQNLLSTIPENRVPIASRLGPLNGSEASTSGNLAVKRKPGRPPGKRSIATTTEENLSHGSATKKRRIQRIQPSPRKKLNKGGKQRVVRDLGNFYGTGPSPSRDIPPLPPSGHTSSTLSSRSKGTTNQPRRKEDFHNPPSPLP